MIVSEWCSCCCCIAVVHTWRSLNRRVVELEANVNDLTEVQQQMSSDENAVSSEARKRLTEQLERGQKLESALQKSQQQAEELENKLQVIHRSFTLLLFNWSVLISLSSCIPSQSSHVSRSIHSKVQVITLQSTASVVLFFSYTNISTSNQFFGFSPLTLLVGQQEVQMARKKRVLACADLFDLTLTQLRIQIDTTTASAISCFRMVWYSGARAYRGCSRILVVKRCCWR